MPRQPRKLCESKTYHVMIRGNDRNDIFIDEEDKTKFIGILYEKNKEKQFILYGFCIMDNHAHLVLNEDKDRLDKLMKRINTSYAYYFNKKYRRIGHVFQDRFKSETIDSDKHLLCAIRYVHNNPIKACMTANLDEYRWSSYNYYIINEKCFMKNIIEKNFILKMFSKLEHRAIELFKEFSIQKNEDKFIEFDDEKNVKSEIYLNEARKYIEEYLAIKNQTISTLKDKNNRIFLIELIKQLKNKDKLSIRQIANLLGIDKSMVYRA